MTEDVIARMERNIAACRSVSSVVLADISVAVLESDLRALIALARKEGWQPIGTAPDRTPVLAIWQWNKADSTCGSLSHDVAERDGQFWMKDGETIDAPTHWQPLPAPPALASGNKG